MFIHSYRPIGPFPYYLIHRDLFHQPNRASTGMAQSPNRALTGMISLSRNYRLTPEPGFPQAYQILPNRTPAGTIQSPELGSNRNYPISWTGLQPELTNLPNRASRNYQLHSRQLWFKPGFHRNTYINTSW